MANCRAIHQAKLTTVARASVMRKKVIFFYIDALNSSFLTPSIMPFLSDLATDHYYKELENVLGYSFAIQSCMLSGKYPEENNHWMPYFYSPENSSMLFKTFKKVGSILALDRLPPLRHSTVGQIRRFLSKNGVHPNNIPLHVIDKIALYPYYYMCELPFFHKLGERLEKRYQASLTYLGPPKIKRHMYVPLLKHIKASNHESELIIAYDDTLDGLGHRLGPYSTECLHYAKSLDRVLSVVYQKLKKIFKKDFIFIAFSDHGQCEQSYNLNLLSELGKKELKFGDDYVCFIDATLALFWPKNEAVKEKMLNILGRIGLGKVIDENLQKRYHIRFNDKRYGEIIFVLEPGVTFFPNFFSPFGSMKGLHGYLPEEEVQKSFLISNEKLSFHFSHVKGSRNLLLNLFS